MSESIFPERYIARVDNVMTILCVSRLVGVVVSALSYEVYERRQSDTVSLCATDGSACMYAALRLCKSVVPQPDCHLLRLNAMSQ